MKHNVFWACTACFLINTSHAEAQNLLKQLGRQLEQQGRQVLRQQGVPIRGGQQGGRPITPNPGQNGVRSHSMPSEGGNRSGGNRDRFGGGGDFLLPGNGGGGGRRNNQFPINQYPANQHPQTQPYPGTIYPNQSSSRIITSSGSDMPTTPVDTDQYVVIRCPKSATGSISYTLSSDRGNFGFTMNAGKEQRFRVSTRWIISYNDGTQQRRYKLEGGKTYTLKTTPENRWQLYSVTAAGS